MLEKLDLSKKLTKTEYKAVMDELEIQAGRLQREAQRLGIPIVILFEGWDAAGKGTMINRLALSLDSRGFVVHPIMPPNQEESFRPFLWRFWTKLPPKGRITVLDRSWCGRVLEDRVNETVKKGVWAKAYDEILSFERQLSSDGYLIIKFFFHIDKKVQKKRFKDLEDNRATRWRVTESDWKHHKQYEDYLKAYEDMLTKTHTEAAPWTIVESHDRRYATVKVFETFVQAVSLKVDGLEAKRTGNRDEDADTPVVKPSPVSILDKVDLSVTLDREKYNRKLRPLQERMRELEHEIYRQRIPVVVVYQGWDAAGKGGNIRRLVQRLDPRGYEVVSIAAPNEIEKQHHYLWRFWTRFPKAGHFVIFDRSWYGRVLVERIEGFCTEAEWRRAYFEINEMEEQWANFGTVIVKFWLHISAEEQLRRFEAREGTEHKQWKINEEDWRNREKWDLYKEAVDEMLYRTSTHFAPWTIIAAESKLQARIQAVRTVVDTLESHLSL
jgi:polyphosphate:AMP phosphotransferase